MRFTVFAAALIATTFCLSAARAQIRTQPSEKAQSAIDAVKSLKAYARATPDLCKGGARSWAKVFGAQTAYDDLYKETFNVGPECANVGGMDALGLELVIPKRIKRLNKDNDFKKRCMQAWTDAIALEKVFLETGADKIIEKFRSTCYTTPSKKDNEGGASR